MPQTGVGQAVVLISPAEATLPPNAMFSLRINAGASPIAFASVELTFDPALLSLNSEVQIGSALSSVVQQTSRAEANATGHLFITLALATGQKNSPPTGQFEIAQITFSPATNLPNQTTSIAIANSAVEVVDTNANEMAFTTQSSSITLNPLVPHDLYLPLIAIGSTGGPGTGLAWTTGLAMPTPRFAFGTTAWDGKMYAVGGDNYTNTPLDVLEAYDTATNSWKKLASMPTRRWALALVAAQNGRLYAIGGFNCGISDCGVYQPHFLGTVEEYDPTTDSWTPRADMPTGRSDLGAALAANGKIYAIGGQNAGGDLATVEEYDPATNVWTACANMPTARHLLGVVAANGHLFAVGGQFFPTVEEYDPSNNTWSSRATLPVALKGFGIATALDSKTYVVSGETSSQIENSVLAYNPVSNIWNSTTSIPTARRGLGLALGSDGRLYAVGGWGLGGSPGYGGSGALGTLEIGTVGTTITSESHAP